LLVGVLSAAREWGEGMPSGPINDDDRRALAL